MKIDGGLSCLRVVGIWLHLCQKYLHIFFQSAGPNISVEAETKFNAKEVDQANQLLSESEGGPLYMK